MDISKEESIAIDYASRMAGEYIDSVGKSDLSSYTAEQWRTLIEVICINYHDKMVGR